MATVDLVAVKKRFGATDVIHGIDAAIADGEFIVIVGPSGCGKSTLLRMVAGLESVTEGEVRIDGTRVNDLEPMDRDIAMVFPELRPLSPHVGAFRTWATASGSRACRARTSPARWTTQPGCCNWATISTVAPATCRAVSGSAWPWAVPSCASPGSSSSTGRCRTSTPSCACRCGWKSATFRPGWASPRSTSPTTRSRR